MKSKKLAVLVATAIVATVGGFVFTMGASAAPATVRLHLGTDGKFFEFGSTRQNLTTASGTCKINSATPVMALGATPSSSSPGLVADAIGVKSGSSNGTPCGQIDPYETLKLTPGANLAGRSFTGVRLDLEMTGNAVAKLTLANATQSKVFKLQTGKSIQTAQKNESDYDKTAPYFASSSPGDDVDACAAPNSSGPNSGANDNCQWTVQAGFNFTSITLTAESCGTVALEGSNDFGNDPNYDTLFYLSNNPPTAVNDNYTTPEDTALNGNVLGNDSDSDGNQLTAALVAGSGPAHGSLTFAANGAFTYTPTLNYHGPDSFKYTASDGIAATQATASITVTPVNDPPEAQNSSVTTDEDSPVTITVATDVDSTAMTTECTGTEGGTLVDNGDGTVTYTPPADFTGGPIELECTSTDDDGASATSSASIAVTVSPVNDAPVAADDSAEVDQDSSVAIPVLDNDSDPDLDPLTPGDFTNVSPLGSSVGANLDGTVQFTPPEGYSGPASFDYRASDGEEQSNVATVTIEVFPVICSNETVNDFDNGTEGSFTRLTDSFECKRYALDADAGDNTVLFQPTGGDFVDYRGFVSFGSTPVPSPGDPVSISLEYDPAGGNSYQPVQWCVAPTYDGDGNVLTATIPAGETWCIAGADLRPNSLGDIVTVWQVFGHDDPKFR